MQCNGNMMFCHVRPCETVGKHLRVVDKWLHAQLAWELLRLFMQRSPKFRLFTWCNRVEACIDAPMCFYASAVLHSSLLSGCYTNTVSVELAWIMQCSCTLVDWIVACEFCDWSQARRCCIEWCDVG